MKNKIKWYEKIFISLFSLFLIISTIWITVMLVTSAKAFFIFEFQKTIPLMLLAIAWKS